MDALRLTKPDDMHLHVRDGSMMRRAVADSARLFGRAVIMPNLVPPVTTVTQATAYRQRILDSLPVNATTFEPLMTLYLTEQTTVTDIVDAGATEFIHAVKYYPANATTNSADGVRVMERVYPVLEAMVEHDLALLVHGEVVDPSVDIFDREAVFIERVLVPLMKAIPELRIVFEHISTQAAVDFVNACGNTLAATITPQHLCFNRNTLFDGGLRPHRYCLPILKAESDRRALVMAATSGSAKYFLGTDSAPHARQAKESACGCAGVYSAPHALELYVEVFEDADCLSALEAFASHYGADFYHLPRNTETITLKKSSWQIPQYITHDDIEIVPLAAGERCRWQLNQ